MPKRACRKRWWKRPARARSPRSEFEQNSIPDLAATWSQALAAEGRNSPADIVEAMKKVTLADVNRVAKAYLAADAGDCGHPQAVGFRGSGCR